MIRPSDSRTKSLAFIFGSHTSATGYSANQSRRNYALEANAAAAYFAGNRNTAHPVNAILNYAYAVLQRRIQIDTVAEGYDPTIGTMHEKRAGSSAFIFDLMEPERPMIDQKVLEFVQSHVL